MDAAPVEILRDTSLPPGEAERKLRDELRVLMHCRHPNIQFLFGYSCTGVGLRLVMERAWGSISDALDSQEFGIAVALTVGSQIASAVQYLHARFIFHRAV